MIRPIRSIFLLIALTATCASAEPWHGEKTQRAGFDKYTFEVAGKPAWVIVPKKPAPGNPWVWRGRWANFHAATDNILLQRGFHVAYVDTGNMLGCDEALDIWDDFYDELTKRHGLSNKPALEAVSRGGLFVFRWAARHPERVACIYLDSAVCDVKSWPLGRGKGDRDSTGMKHLAKYYGLKTERQIVAFRGNPLDPAVMNPVAEAKIPVLALLNTQDHIVPPEENALAFAKRYRKLGAPMEIETLPPGTKSSLKGHHFPVPTDYALRAADFIERHASAVESRSKGRTEQSPTQRPRPDSGVTPSHDECRAARPQAGERSISPIKS